MTGKIVDANATTGATTVRSETVQEETDRLAANAALVAKTANDPNRTVTKAELDAVDAKVPKG